MDVFVFEILLGDVEGLLAGADFGARKGDAVEIGVDAGDGVLDRRDVVRGEGVSQANQRGEDAVRFEIVLVASRNDAGRAGDGALAGLARPDLLGSGSGDSVWRRRDRADLRRNGP